MNFLKKIHYHLSTRSAKPESLGDFLSRDSEDRRRVYDEALKGAQADQLRILRSS